MSPRFLLAPLLAVAGLFFVPTDARACGGCIYGPTPADAGTTQNPSVVTDHRMVLSIDPEATTLWDQIEYAGDPDNFAWVLPIRGAVVVGLGSDAFIDGLDKKTQPTILGPQVFCNAPPQQNFGGGGNDYSSSSSCGCFGSADMEASDLAASASVDTGVSGIDVGIPDEGVVITDRRAVGPYETVQIHGDDSESILGWLRRNKYVIPASIEPVINKYIAEKFDFLAVRLAPSTDVHAMKPIRVSWRGATPMLPLRMVAAGVGESVGIKLFVIGDGRWRTKNFASYTINNADLVWDFKESRSNYSKLRADKAGLQDLHAFALETSIELYGTDVPSRDPDDGGLNMADAAGEASETAVGDASEEVAADAADAPSADAPPGYDGGAPPMISPTESDVSVAFGKKLYRRVTRLRADLPLRHLNVDLELEADDDQSMVPVRRPVPKYINGEKLCQFGISSVQYASVSSPLTPAEGEKPRPTAAACTVGERRSPLRLPAMALFGVAGVALLRVVRRRR